MAIARKNHVFAQVTLMVVGVNIQNALYNHGLPGQVVFHVLSPVFTNTIKTHAPKMFLRDRFVGVGDSEGIRNQLTDVIFKYLILRHVIAGEFVTRNISLIWGAGA